MKFALVSFVFGLLAACASGPNRENPDNAAPTKADIQARDEFAKNLPKPPDR